MKFLWKKSKTCIWSLTLYAMAYALCVGGNTCTHASNRNVIYNDLSKMICKNILWFSIIVDHSMKHRLWNLSPNCLENRILKEISQQSSIVSHNSLLRWLIYIIFLKSKKINWRNGLGGITVFLKVWKNRHIRQKKTWMSI